ncbi:MULTISPECIES: hypothetical protein [unclassified Pseudofrankia]|uniref:hypothetical protein n=1 Tax=unclassified Pseudofrankia TaxID=2994372 RepID=UPI0008D97E77|nr:MULTISPECIES: hypothetical protein [unclassified Pseudofrankia]OHV44450.1 hypothetical protein BCD48_02710 [Pseudofrankia sp. BMG5.36]
MVTSHRLRPAPAQDEAPMMPHSAQAVAALLAGVVVVGFVLVAGGALAPANAGTEASDQLARRPASTVAVPPPPSAAPAPAPTRGPATRPPPPERLPAVAPRPARAVALRSPIGPDLP